MKSKIKEIWQAQADLNKMSHPSGVSTLDAGDFNEQLVQDYKFGLQAEAQELIECFFWKHWSKEAKEGRRWEYINEEAKQNAKVETVDILFFLVSLAQLKAVPFESFEGDWTESFFWTFSPEVSPGRNVSVLSQVLLYFVLENNIERAISTYINIASRIVGRVELEELYFKKLQINIDRQKRGRKQVGDELSELENQSIK